MRAIVEVQENLKNKSDFKQIKMNIAVGQTKSNLTSPKMMMEKLTNGLPIILFYQKNRQDIAALGYISGTWFQLFATDQANKDKVWWRHTHIEIHMHRTFSGTTERLYEVVKNTLTGKMWAGASRNAVKVLVLTGNGSKPVSSEEATGAVTATAEFLALRKFSEVGWFNVAYQETKDRKLPGLEKAKILWLGQREIGDNGYHLSQDTEDRIKRFVEAGGVVILSSQDSDPDKPCGDGWSPEPMLGVDGQRRSDFQVLSPSARIPKRLGRLKQKPSSRRASVVPFLPQGPSIAKGNSKPLVHREVKQRIRRDSINLLTTGQILFQKPNVVKSGQLVMDDTWTKWSKKYTVLATTNAGEDIALAMLKWGRGIYLITALHNATGQDVKANVPLMENLIDFAINHLKSQSESSSVKVLALTGNQSQFEFPALETFGTVGEREISYMETKDKSLPKLNNADILWVGQGEISEEKYLFDKATEKEIKAFVDQGGITIVVGQDSDDKRPCETGWITGQIVGVERNLRRDFQLTPKAGDLFRVPNIVKSGQLRMDDTWTNWDSTFDILATTNSGQDLVVATLIEGKGMYIVTGVQNETQEDVKANAPLMQNLIHFAVKWLVNQ